MARRQGRNPVRRIAAEVLDYFERTVTAAKEALKVQPRPSGSALIIDNAFTAQRAHASLAKMQSQNMADLQRLSEEPAVARIVVRDESDVERSFYVCRAAPLVPSAISYRAPMGRAASWPIDMEDEIQLPAGRKWFQLRERASFRPRLEGAAWDARNAVFEGHDYGPFSVESLLELLGRRFPDREKEVDEIEQWLAEERGDALIRVGRQRTIIDKMALRDQPVLDRFQDNIFRLPIDSRIAVLGPPGSGKTTTLIKRLGFTLDLDHIKEYRGGEDLRIIEESRAGVAEHANSWIMFTPTELLKQYVKEAFSLEGIPAPETHIRTWQDHSRELARSELRVLRTSDGGGPFIVQPELPSLLDGVLEKQKEWFADFEEWQSSQFLADLRTRAEVLSQDRDNRIAAVGRRILPVLDRAGRAAGTSTLGMIVEATGPLAPTVAALRKVADDGIRRELSQHAQGSRRFLDEILAFVMQQEADQSGLEEAVADEGDTDTVDEVESGRPLGDRERAFDSYVRAVRALARSMISGRRLPQESPNGRLIAWLGTRVPSDADLRTLGRRLQTEQAARFLMSAPRRHVFGFPARYRAFRRMRQEEGVWYAPRSFAAHEINGLELDLIILAMLRSIRRLEAESRIGGETNPPPFVEGLQGVFRTQVMVDEVTDFSAVQIACMGALSDPAANSFFACGDFNQRITRWGARTEADLRWMIDDLEIHPIRVTYRHSRQLNELARRIALLSNPQIEEAQLPEATDNDQVKPVLGLGLSTPDAVAGWLRRRIVEIERLSKKLPSIAVLVNSEDEVSKVATALDAALRAHSMRAVACREGRVIGQEMDVRVFDIQHIKGLEFEAVFLVAIDQLASQQTEVFEKYLYVGATRAATFLGVTLEGEEMPGRLEELRSLFQSDWNRT